MGCPQHRDIHEKRDFSRSQSAGCIPREERQDSSEFHEESRWHLSREINSR